MPKVSPTSAPRTRAFPPSPPYKAGPDHRSYQRPALDTNNNNNRSPPSYLASQIPPPGGISPPASFSIKKDLIFCSACPSRPLYVLSRPVLKGQGLDISIDKYIYRVHGEDDSNSDSRDHSNAAMEAARYLQEIQDNYEQDARRPSASARHPSVSVRRPSASVKRPSVSVKRPSVSVKRPSVSVKRSSISVRRPSASVRRPSTMLDVGPNIEQEPRRPSVSHIKYRREPIYDLSHSLTPISNEIWIQGTLKRCVKWGSISRQGHAFMVRGDGRQWKAECHTGSFLDKIRGKDMQEKAESWMWKSGRGQLLAVEEREELDPGEVQLAHPGQHPETTKPKLVVKVPLHDIDLDFLVTAWIARVAWDSMSLLKGGMTWKKFIEIAEMKDTGLLGGHHGPFG